MIKRILQTTAFTMKIRKALSDLDKEQLQIVYKETQKEINRRNKR